jgi:hypothetical protein
MKTDYLKTVIKPTPETSCISNMSQAMDSVQHSFPVL